VKGLLLGEGLVLLPCLQPSMSRNRNVFDSEHESVETHLFAWCRRML
jgi:hypothetical protein